MRAWARARARVQASLSPGTAGGGCSSFFIISRKSIQMEELDFNNESRCVEVLTWRLEPPLAMNLHPDAASSPFVLFPHVIRSSRLLCFPLFLCCFSSFSPLPLILWFCFLSFSFSFPSSLSWPTFSFLATQSNVLFPLFLVSFLTFLSFFSPSSLFSSSCLTLS